MWLSWFYVHKNLRQSFVISRFYVEIHYNPKTLSPSYGRHFLSPRSPAQRDSRECACRKVHQQTTLYKCICNPLVLKTSKDLTFCSSSSVKLSEPSSASNLVTLLRTQSFAYRAWFRASHASDHGVRYIVRNGDTEPWERGWNAAPSYPFPANYPRTGHCNADSLQRYLQLIEIGDEVTTLRRIEGSKKLTAKLPYERDFQKIVHLKIFQWMPNMWLPAWDLVNSWKRQSTTTVLSKTWPDDVQEWEWIIFTWLTVKSFHLFLFFFFFFALLFATQKAKE